MSNIDSLNLIWKSACRGRRCCPKFAIEDDKIHIKDDYGGQVVLTNQEFYDLVDSINELERILTGMATLKEDGS